MRYMRPTTSAVLLLFAVLIGVRPASAALEIDITQGVAAGIPIAVVPFEYTGSEPPPHEVSAVVESDLKRSGRFDTIGHENFLSRPHDHQGVKFKEWRLIKAEPWWSDA